MVTLVAMIAVGLGIGAAGRYAMRRWESQIEELSPPRSEGEIPPENIIAFGSAWNTQ